MVVDSIDCVCALCGTKTHVEWCCGQDGFGIFPYITFDLLNEERLDFRAHGDVFFGRFFNSLHQCTHCGYVAPNLSLTRFGIDKVVFSPEYIAKYKQDDTYGEYDPEKEISLQEAYVFILEKIIKLSPETEELKIQLLCAYLDAAWFYDDLLANYAENAQNISRSIMYRIKAATCFENVTYFSVLGADFTPYDLLMVDVYRRLSMWEKAEDLVNKILPNIVNDGIKETLLKQQELIKAMNCLCHDNNYYEPTP